MSINKKPLRFQDNEGRLISTYDPKDPRSLERSANLVISAYQVGNLSEGRYLTYMARLERNGFTRDEETRNLTYDSESLVSKLAKSAITPKTDKVETMEEFTRVVGETTDKIREIKERRKAA